MNIKAISLTSMTVALIITGAWLFWEYPSYIVLGLLGAYLSTLVIRGIINLYLFWCNVLEDRKSKQLRTPIR